MMHSTTPDLSLVVPVLNEEDAIPIFLETVTPILEQTGLTYEVIFIDDGSTDRTVDIIQDTARQNPLVCLIQLTRNFGKEAALTAGLDWSRGAAVIPMDVDLQDPPELILEFVKLWQDGYDIVFGQRADRSSDNGPKRWSAQLFYRIFNFMSVHHIADGSGDYRLMNRAAVEATVQLRERNRFMKGLFAWIGFNAMAVPFSRPKRAAGHTKFSAWKLWNFAIDGITSFSTVPLRIWTYVGMSVAFGAIIYTSILIIRTLIFGVDVPGYASLMAVVLLLGAVQLISLGIIGEYLGRLYLEVKQRPIYLVRDTIGLKPPCKQTIQDTDKTTQ